MVQPQQGLRIQITEGKVELLSINALEGEQGIVTGKKINANVHGYLTILLFGRKSTVFSGR
jgi:hypothetical protein